MYIQVSILSWKEQNPNSNNQVSYSPRDKDEIGENFKPCKSMDPWRNVRSGAQGLSIFDFWSFFAEMDDS